jgi:hypothetical protein
LCQCKDKTENRLSPISDNITEVGTSNRMGSILQFTVLTSVFTTNVTKGSLRISNALYVGALKHGFYKLLLIGDIIDSFFDVSVSIIHNILTYYKRFFCEWSSTSLQ